MEKQTKIKYLERIEEKLDNLPWYVTEYIDSRKRKLSPTTMLNYCHDYIIFFDWLISEGLVKCSRKEVELRTLESLTVRDGENFLFFLENQLGNSKSTVNRKLAALKSLFNYLQNKAETSELVPYIKRNLMAKLELNPVLSTAQSSAQKISGKILKHEEFNLFRQFIANDYGELIKGNKKLYNYFLFNRERDTAIASLILGSGLRLSEVVGANIEDVDLTENLLRVVRKGGKEQYVYFSDLALYDIKEYIKIRDQRYKPSSKEIALFIAAPVGRKGGTRRLTQRAIEKLVQKYANLYGKPSLNVHALRHSFATRYHKANNDVPKLKDQLGHSSVQTTMIYTHLSDDDLKTAVNKMDLNFFMQ
ncbi:tyrosine recombinase XerS [Paenibacillus amylolyticus]|nr:tyrosine recombinase XerS [Paenibacillus amylolyticus]